VVDLILGALCEVRSEAHYEKHGGLVADSAWHVSRGELPTCQPSERQEASRDKSEDGDKKSRYCRKRWFC